MSKYEHPLTSQLEAAVQKLAEKFQYEIWLSTICEQTKLGKLLYG